MGYQNVYGTTLTSKVWTKKKNLNNMEVNVAHQLNFQLWVNYHFKGVVHFKKKLLLII